MERSNDKQHWNDQRFEIPDRTGDFKSRYDMPSENIQDLVQRRPKAFTKYEISLTTARTESDPFVIASVGRAFQVVFFTTTDAARIPLVNAYCKVRIGENLEECAFDGHNEWGYRGDFEKLYLSWAAQTGVTLSLIVYHFDETPWMNKSNQVTGTISASGATFTVSSPTAYTRTVVTLSATTEIALLGVDATRKNGLVQNNTGAILYVGPTGLTNSGATIGIAIAVGGSLIWNNTAALFGYSVAGGTAVAISET